MKRYWPIWLPYGFVSLLILPAGIGLLSGNSIGKPEAVLWMIRGCLIGPFELLVNPYLTQRDAYATYGQFLQVLTIAALCLFAAIYGLRRQGRLAAGVALFGTMAWILMGLGAAWAWT